MIRALAAGAAVVAALALVPLALADHTTDPWEGTWRTRGSLAGTVVFKPTTDAATRAKAPPCAGGTVYLGAYAGARSGTVAACARKYAMTGRMYEGARRVGDFAIDWAVGLAADGTVGKPTFEGTAAGGRWSGTWLRHGGTIAAQPQSTLTASRAIAKVTAILRKHAVQCEMTWSKITARRIPKGYRVTASVRAFGLAGTASWNVVGSRIAPADEFAASIDAGCPEG